MKVSAGDEVYVHRLAADEGSEVAFDKVLLTGGDSVAIGKPYLGSTVKATVLAHEKDDKVIVFKKKRRKGYKVKNGHRQALTKLRIDSIA